MKELSLHILDIAENSVSAGASRIVLGIIQNMNENSLRLEVSDNGRGMDHTKSQAALSPFYTSRNTRKVGLGLPLLKQHAEMTGGKMVLESVENSGTKVSALFNTDHPDIQPLGDIEGCWYLLASGNPELDVVLECETLKGNFEISSEEVRQSLELKKISGNELAEQLKRLIRNNLENIELHQ